MNREEYLKELSKYLNKLPKDDYEDAINHFEECFDDVGAEGEANLIKELGSPRNVATDLLSNLIIDNENKNEVVVKEKKNMGAGKVILIAILVILAAPIGIPLTIALLAVIFSIFMVIVSVVIAIGSVALAGILVSFKMFYIGILTLGVSGSGSMILLGSSLVGIAITILLFLLAYYFVVFMIYLVKKIVSYVSKKRSE